MPLFGWILESMDDNTNPKPDPLEDDDLTTCDGAAVTRYWAATHDPEAASAEAARADG